MKSFSANCAAAKTFGDASFTCFPSFDDTAHTSDYFAHASKGCKTVGYSCQSTLCVIFLIAYCASDAAVLTLSIHFAVNMLSICVLLVIYRIPMYGTMTSSYYAWSDFQTRF